MRLSQEPDRYSISELAKEISNPFKDLSVTLTGDWVSFNKLMKYLAAPGNNGIKRDIAKAQRDYLSRFQYVLINALLTEGDSVNAPFAEHSYSYNSPTGMVGIRTAKYLNALRSLQITSGTTSQKSVGGQYGAPMSKYALWFEFGTGLQPARPIWAPTFRAMGGAATVNRYLVGAIGRRIKSL
jgi:hypothetical protein